MVCYAPPVPFSQPGLVQRSVMSIPRLHSWKKYDAHFPDRGDEFEWVNNRGFTLVAKGMVYTGGRVNSTRPEGLRHAAYIVRTMEEGWVALDCDRVRWRRLGWLDCILDSHNLVKDKLLETLRSLGADWMHEDEGWRYELLKPLSIDTGAGWRVLKCRPLGNTPYR